ncbi:MAG: type I-U CRISPR-associated protein Cas5/Cas6 [Bryobacterales bacterium]|nr:type I-U CRISPR-associated protein Cas5/Cas6 [Bryobacterales bacterium]
MALASPPSALLQRKAQILRFSLSGTLAPSARFTVPIADALRSAALGAYATFAGDVTSFILSGLCADGTPDKEHAHAFYLPEVDLEDRIVGVRVVNPRSFFGENEVSALRSVTSLAIPGSRALTITLVDDSDDSLVEVASEWRSVTPYVPPRAHYHGKRNLAPEVQVAEELRRDLAADLDVLQVHLATVGRVVVRTAPSAAPAPQAINRTGYHVRFLIGRPICGPVVLGHSAHFGLGQFRPAANQADHKANGHPLTDA